MTFYLIDFDGFFSPILAFNLKEGQIRAIKAIKSRMTLSRFDWYMPENYYRYSEIKNLVNEKSEDIIKI
jgi:hypothetical protein